MKSGYRTLFSFLFPVAVAAGLASCTASGAKDEKHESAAASANVVEAFSLEKSNLSSSIRIPGELVAFQQVDLYAKVNSFVRKLYVDVGSTVVAGQLLATMEAPEMNAQLSGAESRLKSQEAIYLSSKATYDRLLETSKTPGTVSQNDLDLAFARQKSDLAQLEAARAAHREVGDNRNYLEIRAPFGGVITARNVSAGAYVGPSGKGSELPIFTLQEQKKLRLVVSVPEAYTTYLTEGNQVKFTVASLANKAFEGKVVRMAGALDRKLRSQHTEIDVQNDNKELLPGMIVEVSLPLNSATSNFVVPSSAVLNSTKGVYVIKIENKKTKWIPVTTGRSDNGQTEVFGPLQEGDTLVTTASEEVRDDAATPNVRVLREVSRKGA
ncbi:RND family efflux transporter, MFP subunit [Chitinophaga terrae (ex Kim and Jung 2007)]|uniref:RND family efflux transporter, MFP subunit n=1 Tax=Chitinophaga terrae (ex Kim and Jung 2007) TaxID=408074 RepID=A0A1H4EGG6_9BACT|nr:efflux RND transporter periplasmic adaptor subunit [Chitinophaga terrae (ex Kim and Jung 2007)]SEA84145.1 RND family efflux transporter, MFP subunit [Chitinophaga terrae (ex Kim and Jung 2007)]